MADEGATTDQLDPARLRAVFGTIPTSVVIVTTAPGGAEPVGATVGSFATVSLDPPLVAFFLGTTSDTLEALRRAPSFVVNVLREGQEAMCMAFAKRGSDKFAGVSWTADDAGQPALAGVATRIHCDVESITDAGDHQMVTGRVRDAAVVDADATPLVFWSGGLQAVAARTE